MASPSLYDDDDIVTKPHRSSRSSSSRSSSSSSSSSGHHHHHHSSSANANYQKSFDSAVGADIAAQRLPRWAVRIVIYAVLIAACFVLLKMNMQLKRDLANYEGTNAVLAAENAKMREEKKDLLLEIESLEGDKQELSDINRVLRETIEKAQEEDAE